MAYEVKINSIREVDLSVLQLPQVAVFNKPADYPDKAVARVFDNGQPTNIVMVADDPNDLRWDIRKYTNLVWFPRGKDDHENVVGVYM